VGGIAPQEGQVGEKTKGGNEGGQNNTEG